MEKTWTMQTDRLSSLMQQIATHVWFIIVALPGRDAPLCTPHTVNVLFSSSGKWLLSECHWEVNGSWSTISILTLGWLCVHMCEGQKEWKRPLQKSNINILKFPTGVFIQFFPFFNSFFIYTRAYDGPLCFPYVQTNTKTQDWISNLCWA